MELPYESVYQVFKIEFNCLALSLTGDVIDVPTARGMLGRRGACWVSEAQCTLVTEHVTHLACKHPV